MQFLVFASKVFWLDILMSGKRVVILAREANVAQLTIIEIGKSSQRPSTIAPPH
jgi:hypothetical protein